MELSSLMRDKYVAYAKRAITHLGRVKLAFTISSLGLLCGTLAHVPRLFRQCTVDRQGPSVP